MESQDAVDTESSRPDAVSFFHTGAEAYEDQHYGTGVRSFMTVRHERVLEFVDRANLSDGAPVLDAGCGPGVLASALCRRGLHVHAMDAAQGMLDRARARLEASSCTHEPDLRLGDIESLPYDDGVFDLVCSTGVIEYVPEDSKTLGEFHRVLKPGGHLVLPVTNRFSPVLWLDNGIEWMKRRPWLLRPFNRGWTALGRSEVRPRHFEVRKHSPSRFRRSLSEAGFAIQDETFFFFLPWPRPLDKFLPTASSRLGARMDPLASSPLAPLGEGFVVLARKPA